MSADRTKALPDALRGASLGGAPIEEVRTTHISWVFLTATEAYKVKRPVRLPFLDFSTLESRREACEAEVKKNRRLAGDVYRGVLRLCEGDGGLSLGGPGAVVDYVVHMRRLADEDSAAARLRAGSLSWADVDSVARRVAAFHEAVGPAPDGSLGDAPALQKHVEENFRDARSTLDQRRELDEAEAFQRAFLAQSQELFERRAQGGRVRDGHGDLRLDHVYFMRDGTLRILDCVEFSDRYSVSDVTADLAFFSMDLAFHGRVDLAERFIATYAAESGDFEVYSLVDFFEAYRALVRGKIEGFVATDPSAAESERRAADAAGRRYLLLAVSSGRRATLAPSLTAVGGLIGAGKSSVSDALAREFGAPVIEADRTRKQLLGVPAHEHVDEGAFRGAYDPAFTERVYEEMFRRAGLVLASGRPVVLDASFRSAALRGAARDLAKRHGVPFRFVECRAPLEVLRTRLLEREKRLVVSDARLPLLADFAKRFEAVVELGEEEHLVVDTSGPLEAVVDGLRHRRLVCDLAWPSRLTA